MRPTTTDRDEVRHFLESCRPRRRRTHLEFAEQEIRIPDGPFKGLRFRTDRQPAARHVLDSFDSVPLRRRVITGPSQSGKTLVAFCEPILYHLFEQRENVVAGVPTLEMSGDKWREDLKPVIEKTRYKELLPRTGAGSKDGTSNLTEIEFRNGATLKFMGGGGGDKQRAGFTSRVLVITETDGLDVSGEASREADKIAQLEARVRSFTSKKLPRQFEVYMECTVTTDKGRTWREYKAGTESRILSPCRGCGEWILPEREHFIGWEDADDELDAGENATFVCPECGILISDDDREVMLAQSVLVHDGQEVTPAGEVVGETKRTKTLGLRWSAFHNLFIDSDSLGSAEWRASQADDAENSEREQSQFWWATPVKADNIGSELDVSHIQNRTNGLERGTLPDDTLVMVAAADVGKWQLHWGVAVGTARGTIEVVDYGIRDVTSNNDGEQVAIRKALDWLNDHCNEGWEGQRPAGRAYDSGYQGQDSAESYEKVVYEAAKRHGDSVYPSKGFGYQQKTTYSPPAKKSTTIRELSADRWHVKRLKGHRVDLLEFDADEMKSRVHSAITRDITAPGAMLLFEPENDSGERWRRRHYGFARELTAERSVLKTEKASGRVRKVWEKRRKNNHFLDVVVLLYLRLLMLGFEPGVTASLDLEDDKEEQSLADFYGEEDEP